MYQTGNVSSTSSEPRLPRPGSPVDPRRVLRVLAAAKLWLLLDAIVCVAAGLLLYRSRLGHQYEATALLFYEPVASREGSGDQGQRDLRTLVDSVKIAANLEETKRRLRLRDELDTLGSRISVIFEDQSNAVSVSATASQPPEAAALAATVVDVFLAHRTGVERTHLETQVQSTTQAIWVATAKRNEARAAYDAFRREHKIGDLSAERQRAIESAAQLRAASDRAQSVVRTASASTAPGPTPTAEVQLNTPESQRLAEARIELTSALSLYSEQYPKVLALRSQIAQLEPRVAAQKAQQTQEIARRRAAETRAEAVRSSAEAPGAIPRPAGATDSPLKGLAESAERRITQLSDLEGTASRLLSVVQVADLHLAQLETSLVVGEDAARNASSGFRVAAPATEPRHPVRNVKRTATIAAAAGAFFLLAPLLLLLGELWGLRVRTPAELAFWGNGPVVGSTAWSADGCSLHELAYELDDVTPDEAGKTLILGATEADRPLAIEFAHRLKANRTRASAGVAGDAAALASYRPPSFFAAQISESDCIDEFVAWVGLREGPPLRRAARLADRVLILVRAGALSGFDVAKIRTRLGRSDGVGYLLVAVAPAFSDLPDRVGPVRGFWAFRRPGGASIRPAVTAREDQPSRTSVSRTSNVSVSVERCQADPTVPPAPYPLRGRLGSHPQPLVGTRGDFRPHQTLIGFMPPQAARIAEQAQAAAGRLAVGREEPPPPPESSAPYGAWANPAVLTTELTPHESDEDRFASEAQALPARRSAPRRTALVLLAFATLAFVLLAGYAVFQPRAGVLSAKLHWDPLGREILRVSCPTCPEGTVVTLAQTSAKFQGGTADLQSPSSLTLGHNRLLFGVERPRSGSEQAELLFAVPYRLHLEEQPRSDGERQGMAIVVEAVPGFSWKVGDSAVATGAEGRGTYFVDMTDSCLGPSEAPSIAERTIPYAVASGSEHTVDTGSLQVRVQVTPLRLDAPGPRLVTDRDRSLLAGRTVSGAAVTVNGRPIELSTDGSFADSLPLTTMGESVLDVRARMAGRLSRFVRVRVKRVGSLAAEGLAFAERHPVLLDHKDDAVGQLVVLEGSVLESSVRDHAAATVLRVEKGCARALCRSRIIQRGANAWKPGERVRVFGRISPKIEPSPPGADASAAPIDVDAEFVLPIGVGSIPLAAVSRFGIDSKPGARDPKGPDRD